MSELLPVCCYCDAVLSCSACGREQPTVAPSGQRPVDDGAPTDDVDLSVWCLGHPKEAASAIRKLRAVQPSTAMTSEVWQDISTAPKDGTVILLASTDERGSKNLIECSWWSEERCWIDNGRRGKPDEYEADWYQVDNTDFSFSRPTHWRMPLSRPRNDETSGGARS